jgi:hypothetical protein
MPTHDDKDLHPSFPDDDIVSNRNHEADEKPDASGTSEIAMRLSVLGKLVIPPATPR